MQFSSPQTLADRTKAAILKVGLRPPDGRTLTAMFETMYAASVHTEEGQTTTFHVAFMDPADCTLTA